MASITSTVTGPVEGGKYGWPFHASTLDVASFGYEEAEYFLSGTARRYRFVAGATATRDGHWQAEVAGEAAFKTRFIVYRPKDAARFNGTVIVTWNNVTAGHDLFGSDSHEILEDGFALVCVTTQKVGIDGLPPVRQGLAHWDAERYGDLSIPSDDYSFDVLSQAGLAVGPSRNKVLDPMGGLPVRRVIAQGASQSAGRLATYINAIQPLERVFDGFILQIYFGRGTPLEVGDTVVNINAPATGGSTANQLIGHNLLRDDLGVPIFVVNSELEAIACFGVRQADTETFRYWETAGTCHTSQQGRRARQQLLDRDQLVSRPIEDGLNGIPLNPVYDAVYYHMQRWLTDHIAPPRQPKIEFAGEPPEVVRDVHGIAKGGIRLPQAEIPLETNSAIPLAEGVFPLLGGSSHPFGKEKAERLYGSQEKFLSAFELAANRAVEAGVLRPREIAGLLTEARSRWPRQ